MEIGFRKIKMAIFTDDMMQFCKLLCLIQHAESTRARLAVWLCNSVSAGHGATVNCKNKAVFSAAVEKTRPLQLVEST